MGKFVSGEIVPEGRPSTRNIHVVELLHRLDQLALEAGRRRLGFQRPGHDIDVVFFQQRFEPGQFFFGPVGMVPVEEPSDHEIRLARAAVPCAKFGALFAAFECEKIGHSTRVGHSPKPRKRL